MLDDILLATFMETFYGYGTYDAPYWFVGMEEGGGGTFASAEGRINAWIDRGRTELEDPRGTAADLSRSPWFRSYPRLQSTWKQLIRMTLVAQGIVPAVDRIRAYQRDRLGTGTGETCLLELLPLPSPSTRHWFYKDYSDLPYLQSREAYMAHFAPMRAAHLRACVEQHKPKAVVFYSFNWWYRQWWQQITPVPYARISTPDSDILKAATPTTTFLIVKHPVTVGVTNHYFETAGKLLTPQ